jgi:hypothetical protein
MNTDIAYSDRQDLINNLPAGPVLAKSKVVSCNSAASYRGQARESTLMLESRERSDDSRDGRQSNLSGRDSEQLAGASDKNVMADVCTSLPAQTLPDTWEAIAAQLDHWADMDKQYWQQRREKEYAAWINRKYGV